MLLKRGKRPLPGGWLLDLKLHVAESKSNGKREHESRLKDRRLGGCE